MVQKFFGMEEPELTSPCQRPTLTIPRACVVLGITTNRTNTWLPLVTSNPTPISSVTTGNSRKPAGMNRRMQLPTRVITIPPDKLRLRNIVPSWKAMPSNVSLSLPLSISFSFWLSSSLFVCLSLFYIHIWFIKTLSQVSNVAHGPLVFFYTACHSLVDYTPLYENCMFDMCACTVNLRDCLCPMLSQYAQDCAAQGVNLQWRSNVSECRKLLTAIGLHNTYLKLCFSSHLIVSNTLETIFITPSCIWNFFFHSIVCKLWLVQHGEIF